MMKNVKVIGLVSALALMSACSTNSYKIVQEDKEKLTKVPKWYMADFNEKKACDMSFMADNGLIKTDDDGKVCIFGVGTAVSPDLNLAIEKGKMIAKAELADIILPFSIARLRSGETAVPTPKIHTLPSSSVLIRPLSAINDISQAFFSLKSAMYHFGTLVNFSLSSWTIL
jgi:hypothetical protein